nr:PIN domain-containing protein [uncultured Treponema sp.]
MSKIYFDTTPLIYFLDDEKPFSDKIVNFILNHQGEDNHFLTSSITDTEYLVFPFRMQNFEKIAAYETFLQDFNFQIVEPNRSITKKSRRNTGKIQRHKRNGFHSSCNKHLFQLRYFSDK